MLIYGHLGCYIEIIGIDWSGPVPLQQVDSVDVPTFESPLSQQETTALQAQINPLAQSDMLGVDLYLAVREFIHAAMP